MNINFNNHVETHQQQNVHLFHHINLSQMRQIKDFSSSVKIDLIQHQEKKAVKEQSMYSFLQNKETKLMNRFINFLSKKGKKAKAQNLFYNSLKILLNIITKEKIGKTNIASIKYINKLNSSSPVISTPSNHSPVPLLPVRCSSVAKRQVERANETPSSRSCREHVKNNEQGGINNYDSKIFHIFDEAILNIQPLFEVKKVRVAGTTYQVPALISQKRQENKAMNWLIESTLERKKKSTSQSFEYCLAFEIYEAFLKQGYARQKRSELHKLAESNRAFSHFRWW